MLLVGEHASIGAALREGRPLVIGRASPSDVVLDDRALSRTHARVVWREGALHVEDLGSTNGTFVDGARVASARVEPRQRLMLGSVEARLHVTRFDGAASEPDSSTLVDRLRGEILRGRTFDRPVCVLALRRSDSAQGGDRRLEALLRPVDFVQSVGAHVSLVVLAEVGAAQAPAWAERLASALGDAGARFGAAVFPDHADDADALVAAALDALRRSRSTTLTLASPSSAARRPPPDGSPSDGAPRAIVLESPPMRALYETVERAARTKLPVLILGETGAGKELVARALHERSPRAAGPFKAVNCASIPASLLESTLFGHEKGAFTGAAARSAGLFEQAEGGTVFLDEVGELPPAAQAALLRVLETKQLVRIGGTRDLTVDVRVVAATHRDLEAMVDAGSFRADLLYRLDALTLEVPPLRERVEDVIPLARLFLTRAREEWETPASHLDDAALDALCAHDWPGNVRQLKNVIERAAAMALGPSITVADLPRELREIASTPEPAAAPSTVARPLSERVEAFERQILREVLEQTGGNQSEAARILRIPRRTLAHKAQRHGLVR